VRVVFVLRDTAVTCARRRSALAHELHTQETPRCGRAHQAADERVCERAFACVGRAHHRHAHALLRSRKHARLRTSCDAHASWSWQRVAAACASRACSAGLATAASSTQLASSASPPSVSPYGVASTRRAPAAPALRAREREERAQRGACAHGGCAALRRGAHPACALSRSAAAAAVCADTHARGRPSARSRLHGQRVCRAAASIALALATPTHSPLHTRSTAHAHAHTTGARRLFVGLNISFVLVLI
jgi:hypothetical protein